MACNKLRTAMIISFQCLSQNINKFHTLTLAVPVQSFPQLYLLHTERGLMAFFGKAS